MGHQKFRAVFGKIGVGFVVFARGGGSGGGGGAWPFHFLGANYKIKIQVRGRGVQWVGNTSHEHIQ